MLSFQMEWQKVSLTQSVWDLAYSMGMPHCADYKGSSKLQEDPTVAARRLLQNMDLLNLKRQEVMGVAS
ncbi:hypothetical protein BaRGS_00004443 [Batillaria attramentaria]|uniref:Uncharacterized protein n=1 Tax=Batillaria attramentaria TaxID=370345 RepID=A0ABD0LWW8_9CAEN